jgi:hypothetical protein
MQIINDFGDYLLNNPSDDIRDVFLLPYPKEDIKKAIFSTIEEGVDKDNLKVLTEALYLLAHFQEGVGKTPLSPLGVDTSVLPKTDGEWLELAEKITNKQSQEKYADFNNMVQKEIQSIVTQVDSLSNIKPNKEADRLQASPQVNMSRQTYEPPKVQYIRVEARAKSHWAYFGNIFIVVLIIFAVTDSFFKLEQHIGWLTFYAFCFSCGVTPFIGRYLNNK